MAKNIKKAGRKPLADQDRMMRTVSLRLPSDLYDRLQKEVKKGKAQEISTIIRSHLINGLNRNESLDFFRTRGAEALALLIGKMVGQLERFEQQSWLRDRFMFETVRAAIEYLLLYYAPKGKVQFPEIKKEFLESLHQEIANANDQETREHFQAILDGETNPVSRGHATARGIIHQVAHATQRITPVEGGHHGDDAYDFFKINRTLTSGKGK